MTRRAVTYSLFFALSCTSAVALRGAESADRLYQRLKPLLKSKCYACHGAIKQEAGLRLDTGGLIRKGGDSGPPIDSNKVGSSLLLKRVTAEDESERMPPEGEPLTKEQAQLLRDWIAAGARSPKDEVPQVDPKEHWAYQPIVTRQLPKGQQHPIDHFIRRRLEMAGVQAVEPAKPEVLVRRLYLDLHGLPPTVNETQMWVKRLKADSWKPGQPVDQEAFSALVDYLLASPRYGERWAQHWLDVVRYADTHGFEVNTPRQNAWPYRDYVIDAFNTDKPYDRFVFEQLAGDSVGEHAATGFLVAAAVLLPGQIGADAASKRLARQDSLDEIIVGTSATFLGATLGCARCHNHKFDPLSQRDYYAMQAFFAGVEYGDRPVQDADQSQRKAEAKKLDERIAELTKTLGTFEPLAFTGRMIVVDDEDLSKVTLLKKKMGHGTNPAGDGRGYSDDTGDAQRLANISKRRYTWWQHKPGEDVFTWNPKVAGRFRLWISWGVHGSGVHTRDARYVLDRDGDLATRDDQTEVAKADQYYFSGVNKGTTEKKPLWSGLLDAGVHEWTPTTRLVLRGGMTGTGITADVIVMQELTPRESKGQARRIPRLRDPVRFDRNVERFAPVDTKFVRFTTLATTNNNRYQPCLDELEVFRAGDVFNVARDSHGTKPSSSGNLSETGKHQLKHINDGEYGNSKSWISSQLGGGWVQLEFPKVEKIDRIEWGRDRQGKFKDRLPVRYRIDTSLDGKAWKTVAQSDDRVVQGTPHDRIKTLLRGALGGAEQEPVGGAEQEPVGGAESNSVGGADQSLSKWAAELDGLQRRKAELNQPRMVYAGKFRKPDVTKVLHRGDPEQPLDKVRPQVPVILGKLKLAEDTNEQQRRVALARWITARSNPLTARVMANRVWQYHFGRGLVDTPSDLGLNGAQPSHPLLLDWLAQEFVSRGWSLKKLHRLILTSSTYQRSSRVDQQAQVKDADSRLLWRFPSRRLEAEAIRDSILYVSGRLNLKMGGPGFDFFKSRGGLSGFPPVDKFEPEQLRRMIYSHKIRMERVPVFGAFDCPDAGQPTPKRSQSTTPIQALNLFNSRFVLDQSNALAKLAAGKNPGSVQQQVDFVFRSVVGRLPGRQERAASVAAARDHGLITLCRVLFNSNEFLFIP